MEDRRRAPRRRVVALFAGLLAGLKGPFDAVARRMHTIGAEIVPPECPCVRGRPPSAATGRERRAVRTASPGGRETMSTRPTALLLALSLAPATATGQGPTGRDLTALSLNELADLEVTSVS